MLLTVTQAGNGNSSMLTVISMVIAAMEVHRNERGDIVLRPIDNWPVREYTNADLEMFAREDELTPELEDRLNSLLEREPRLFRR
jgi:hypothetical protein